MASLIRREQLSGAWVQPTLAENLGVSTDATNHALWFCGNNLKLHSIVGECRALLQGLCEVSGKIWLDVVPEDIEVIRRRQGVRERHDMDAAEFGQRMQASEYLRALVHNAPALCIWLEGRDFKRHATKLRRFTKAYHGAPARVCEDTPEVGRHMVIEKLLSTIFFASLRSFARFVLAQTNKL